MNQNKQHHTQSLDAFTNKNNILPWLFFYRVCTEKNCHKQTSYLKTDSSDVCHAGFRLIRFSTGGTSFDPATYPGRLAGMIYLGDVSGWAMSDAVRWGSNRLRCWTLVFLDPGVAFLIPYAGESGFGLLIITYGSDSHLCANFCLPQRLISLGSTRSPGCNKEAVAFSSYCSLFEHPVAFAASLAFLYADDSRSCNFRLYLCVSFEEVSFAVKPRKASRASFGWCLNIRKYGKKPVLGCVVTLYACTREATWLFQSALLPSSRVPSIFSNVWLNLSVMFFPMAWYGVVLDLLMPASKHNSEMREDRKFAPWSLCSLAGNP